MRGGMGKGRLEAMLGLDRRGTKRLKDVWTACKVQASNDRDSMLLLEE